MSLEDELHSVTCLLKILRTQLIETKQLTNQVLCVVGQKCQSSLPRSTYKANIQTMYCVDTVAVVFKLKY